MINDKFHMRVTCVDDCNKKVESDTVNFWPVMINMDYHGILRYYITDRNLKYCLDGNKTLKLKFMVKLNS